MAMQYLGHLVGLGLVAREFFLELLYLLGLFLEFLFEPINNKESCYQAR